MGDLSTHVPVAITGLKAIRTELTIAREDHGVCLTLMSTPKAETTYDDFLKVDLRVGTIKSASRVPKSDKLLALGVDFGEFQRQVLAGIGKSFEPETLIDRQFVFIVNLPPRKMMGLESEGMILATGEPDRLALMSPTSQTSAGADLG